MRTTLILSLTCSLLHCATAQPRPHVHRHQQRDVVVVTNVIVDVVTTTAVDEVVYVDTQGDAISTFFLQSQTVSPTSAVDSKPVTTCNLSLPPSSVASQASVVSSAAASPALADDAEQDPSLDKAVAAAIPESIAKKPVQSVGQTSPAKVANTKPNIKPALQADSAKGTSGLGIVYSPYNADHTCKTQAQVDADFTKIKGYGFVRIYGTDCDQVSTVSKAAKAKGMKIFAGIYDINEVNGEVGQLIEAVNGDWSHIETVGIGNEVVNSQGAAMVGPVLNALGAARTQLKAAGYKGNIVTVDTFDAVMAHTELCHASDFAAVNAHAFFDSDVDASHAGEWAIHTVQGVSSACGGKRTVLTESGWPSRGSNNGQAHPSPADQATAIQSLKSKFTNNLIIFSAFNDLWKSNNAGTFGTEQYWGVLGDAP